MLEAKENSTSHNWPDSASWGAAWSRGAEVAAMGIRIQAVAPTPRRAREYTALSPGSEQSQRYWVNPEDCQLAVPEARAAPGLVIHLVPKGQPLELTEASVTLVLSSSYTLHLHIQYPVILSEHLLCTRPFGEMRQLCVSKGYTGP